MFILAEWKEPKFKPEKELQCERVESYDAHLEHP